MLWHKCKNGTLLNLEMYRLCRVIDCGQRGYFLVGYPTRPLSDRDRWPGGCDELVAGTRKDCEAELRAIEKKVMAWQKPVITYSKTQVP